MDKKALREILKKKRHALSKLEQSQASAKIFKQILDLKAYQNAKKIGLYFAKGKEIDLNPLWQHATSHQKNCFFPAITPDHRLLFFPATLKSPLIKNRYGIDEPLASPKEAAPLQDFDLIFLPLLAFDKLGRRLGMGGGYYDKTLAALRGPLLLGLAYNFQYLPQLPSDPWDVCLNAVITPEKLYDFSLKTQANPKP